MLRSLRRQSGNGFPSFATSAGNHSVMVSWDAVPHTTSYTLYYATNGSLPSEQVGTKVENVTSPVVLSDLVNGNVHVFQLKTVPEAEWPESVSDYIKAIPLSQQTLAPQVTGELRQTRVEWPPIPGAQEFEVWRSTAQDGPFYNISGPIESTSFLDGGVAKGSWYWYKVKPFLSGSLISYANGTQLSPFRIHSPRHVGTCPTTSAEDVAISGSYAYVADHDSGLRVIDITNPLAPALKGTCATTSACGVAISGSYAFVADYTAGLRVIDVSAPASPTLVCTCDTDYSYGVAVSGTYAYVADAVCGLRVINLIP